MIEHEKQDESVPAPPERYKLLFPVTFAGQTVEELVFKPTARAFKGYEQRVTQDGSSITVTNNPYAAAVVACKMAGMVEAFAEQLHPADMTMLSGIANSFLAPGPGTGKTPSR